MYVETGTTAEAHFLQLLEEEEDGELARTGFVRVQVGEKNVVSLPDEVPRRPPTSCDSTAHGYLAFVAVQRP